MVRPFHILLLLVLSICAMGANTCYETDKIQLDATVTPPSGAPDFLPQFYSHQ